MNASVARQDLLDVKVLALIIATALPGMVPTQTGVNFPRARKHVKAERCQGKSIFQAILNVITMAKTSLYLKIPHSHVWPGSTDSSSSV